MKKLFHEILNFGMIGIFNTVLGLVLVMVFYNVWHWGYWTASGVSYVIGSIISYEANKKLTFKAEGGGFKPVLRFAVHIIVCYFIAYGIAKPLAGSLVRGYFSGAARWIGKLIHMEIQAVEENAAILTGIGLFIVLNFIGQKFFVFTDSKKEGEPGRNRQP